MQFLKEDLLPFWAMAAHTGALSHTVPFQESHTKQWKRSHREHWELGQAPKAPRASTNIDTAH